jgi:hypothetical protein
MIAQFLFGVGNVVVVSLTQERFRALYHVEGIQAGQEGGVESAPI